MVARWTIVNADVRINFSRQRVGACNVHFCSASTCGQFSAAGNQQSFKIRHGVPHRDGKSPADVRSRGAFLHFDNLSFELVTSAEFHGSLLSSAAAKIARDGV